MATEKKYHLEINATTQEEILREFTPEEYAQAEIDAAAAAEARTAQDAADAAKATAKAEAIAALVALGLTEDQVAALTA